jgi:hypothetical protein
VAVCPPLEDDGVELDVELELLLELDPQAAAARATTATAATSSGSPRNLRVMLCPPKNENDGRH